MSAGFGVAACLLSMLLFGAARAEDPPFVGLSVNGQCRVGSCPPREAQANESALTSFSVFASRLDIPVQIDNGDQFRIVGDLIQSNTGACDVEGAQPIAIQYLGNRLNPAAASHDDRVTIVIYHRWKCPISQRGGGKFTFSGTWSPAAAVSSVASWSNILESGQAIGRAGPFGPPSFSWSGASPPIQISGDELNTQPEFVVSFGVGSRVGAFVTMNGAPSPSPPGSSQPESGNQPPAHPALDLAGIWVGSAFPIDPGRGGAEVQMTLHQHGDVVEGTTHEQLLFPPHQPRWSDADLGGLIRNKDAVLQERGAERCASQGSITLTLTPTKDGRLSGLATVTAPNCIASVFWLANTGDPQAVNAEKAWMLGTEAFREGNLPEATRQFARGSDLGSAASMFSLARLLDSRAHLDPASPDHAKASQLFKDSASRGFAPAQHYAVCTGQMIANTIRALHDWKDLDLASQYAWFKEADRRFPGLIWNLKPEGRSTPLDTLVNPTDMSDDEFACNVQFSNNLVLEAPSSDNGRDPAMDLFARYVNAQVRNMIYVDSYIITRRADHSCRVRWVQRTFGPQVLNVPPDPSWSVDLPDCW